MTLRLKSSISHSRGYFPGRLYDSILLFLIPGGTFPGGSTIHIFYFTFSGVFSRRLYDSNLQFLIPEGTFPSDSTIQFFYFSFREVLSRAALRFISSISHSRGYFPRRLYDSNLLFLIPGGTFPGGSTIQFFYFSFQGVFSQATLRFTSSISHPRGYFPRLLYHSK